MTGSPAGPAAPASLFERVLSPEVFEAGWARVRDNHGSAGVDGVTIGDFGDGLRFNLDLLRREIREARYRPLPLHRILVDKGNGEPRALSIPAVRDRVCQAAVLEVVGPIVERELETCSFAYRPGRSVRDAVRLVREYRDHGYRWVVDADVDSFFDTLDHDRLLARVESLLKDARLLRLISQWVSAEVWDGESVTRLQHGIPQGSVVSPMLANLFLDELDEALLGKGLKVVRFADDFLILCRERAAAVDALELSEEILEGMGLALNDEKTAVTSFDDGFKYLGVVFLRTLIMKPFETCMKVRRILYCPPPLDLAAYRAGRLSRGVAR